MKIQNFQNPIRTFVAGTIGRLYTKNQVNWSIFDWVITFSVEKAVPKSQREKRKKLPFSGQKSANFQNFSNFFINSIQLPEIHTWSKFQLIWAIFWHFMTILDSIFDHFYIYNLYIKTRAGRNEDVHVSGHNSRTEHPMNLSYGILDCPWKGLYDRVENEPFWRKWLYPPPPPRAFKYSSYCYEKICNWKRWCKFCLRFKLVGQINPPLDLYVIQNTLAV